MIKPVTKVFASTAAVALPDSIMALELWSVESNDLTITFGGGEPITLEGSQVLIVGPYPQPIDVSSIAVTGLGTVGVIYFY